MDGRKDIRCWSYWKVHFHLLMSHFHYPWKDPRILQNNTTSKRFNYLWHLNDTHGFKFVVLDDGRPHSILHSSEHNTWHKFTTLPQNTGSSRLSTRIYLIFENDGIQAPPRPMKMAKKTTKFFIKIETLNYVEKGTQNPHWMEAFV